MAPPTESPTRIRVYNSLTRRKEPLQPLTPGRISLYACGVTVYDECHLGHALQSLVFDMIFRYLRWRGFDVRYARNYTDVDDKIIARAQKLGISPLELSARMIEEERKDLGALGVAAPTYAPKVSDYIPQIIRFVQGLIDKGAAYRTAKGNVYYRVRAKADYGKLSGRNVDELRSGGRVQVEDDKEDELDFALWKVEDVAGATWDSPFGRGRPGWHIECSVMGFELLGPRFDIHGGGLDLIFPHHENEVAQSESFVGGQHVNVWVHNGLLTVDKEKMSKSLGNFVTLKQGLLRYGAELIRFTQLQFHYRSNVDFNPKAMAVNAARLAAIYDHLLKIAESAEYLQYGEGNAAEVEAGLPEAIRAHSAEVAANIERRFATAMDDDFNAPEAIVALIEGMRLIEELLRLKKASEAERVAAAWLAWRKVKPLAAVLGLFQREPREVFADLRGRFTAATGVEPAWIAGQIAERKAARDARDFARADAIRGALIAKGVELRDGRIETDWFVTKDALERLFG